jgi:hypothetical protein
MKPPPRVLDYVSARRQGEHAIVFSWRRHKWQLITAAAAAVLILHLLLAIALFPERSDDVAEWTWLITPAFWITDWFDDLHGLFREIAILVFNELIFGLGAALMSLVAWWVCRILRLPASQRPRLLRRPRILAGVALLLLVGGVLALVTSFRPWIWYQSKNEYYWHLHRTSVCPPDTVAFDDDPRRFVEYQRKFGPSVGTYPPYIAWDICPSAGRLVGEWKWLPLFVHGRTTAGGSERIVVVGFRGFGGNAPRKGEEMTFSLAYYSIPLYAAAHDDTWRYGKLPIRFISGQSRLYAGQPDPKDASHFTIDYEISGVRGTVDGWLQPDDTVKMQIRDGPAAKPTAPSATTQSAR